MVVMTSEPWLASGASGVPAALPPLLTTPWPRPGPVSYTHLDVYKRQGRCAELEVGRSAGRQHMGADHAQRLSGRVDGYSDRPGLQGDVGHGRQRPNRLQRPRHAIRGQLRQVSIPDLWSHLHPPRDIHSAGHLALGHHEMCIRDRVKETPPTVPQVVFAVCMDVSKFNIVDKDGKSIVPPSRKAHVPVNVSVLNYKYPDPAQWRVGLVTEVKDGSC